MKRREFITLLGGAAAAWPFAAGAQQSPMPAIGLLHPGSPEANAKYVASLRKGVAEANSVEGRNIAIEYRWGHSDSDRLPELASGSTPAALAAKSATDTIPVVFLIGTDPVKVGLIASLARPGGNITGITILNVELLAKGPA